MNSKELNQLFDLLNKLHDGSKEKTGRYTTSSTETPLSRAIELVQDAVAVF